MTQTTTCSVIIGVDTHKATHVAVAIDNNGSRLAALSAPATAKGYLALEDWACALGSVASFGIEGTGSYGAGLSRHLLAQGHKVIEVTRPNRQLRYQHGKSDIPASSGKTNRFRLNRGGNRQANAALYRVAIVRMRNHQPTLAYVSKRKKEGKSNREIIRCLKRYIVREIYTHLCRSKTSPATG